MKCQKISIKNLVASTNKLQMVHGWVFQQDNDPENVQIHAKMVNEHRTSLLMKRTVHKTLQDSFLAQANNSVLHKILHLQVKYLLFKKN